MDILKDLIGSNAMDLMSTLTEKAGFTGDQARAFVPEAADSVADVLKNAGDVDFSDVGTAAGTLADRVDVASLAGRVGIDTQQAQNGLAAMLPRLLELIQQKAGGTAGIASLLGGLKEGGLGGALDSLNSLGKIFGK